MKKKLIMICATVLVVLLALFAFAACNTENSEVEEELVKNGDFSDYDSSEGKLADWYTSSNINYSIDERTDGTDDGSVNYELILQSKGTSNSDKTYQYVYQRIQVDVNRIYKVSVEIKISADINHDYGAYFTFLENTSFKTYRNTKTVVDGSDTATFITLTAYVRPRNTDYLTLALCMGDEKNGTVGKVLFDNVSMQRVDASSVPDGEKINNIRKLSTVIDNTTASGIIFTVLCTVGSAALLLAAYIVIKRIYANKNAFADFGTVDARFATKKADKPKWYQTDAFIACMIALGALAVRAILLFTTFGNGGDMASTLTQARKLGVKNGVANYFSNNPSSSLSPGVAYILAVVGAIGYNLDNRWVSVILRLINVLADIAIVLIVYFYGKKKSGNRLSTVYSALYAILPFTFVLSGMNGSFESVLVALLLTGTLLMLKKQYLATYGVFTLAVVLDIRAFAVVPIVLAYFVYCYLKDNENLRKFTSKRAMIVFGVPAAFVAGYLLTLPAGFNMIKAGDAFANFKLIVQEMTNNPYFVHNAFNLYGMVAMNDKAVTNSVSILNLVFLLVLEAYVISLYFKNRNRNELLLLISFTLTVIAVFTVKVDYTYLFLGFVFALIYTMISGDVRMYGVLSGYGVLGILGIAQLFSQSGFMTFDSSKSSLMSYETTDPFFIIFCVLSVLLTGYYVYVTYSITNNTKIVDITAMPEPFFKTVGKSIKNLKARFKKT